MRHLLVLALLLPAIGHAKELCHDYENTIEPDHQWKESDFTKERARKALAFLTGVVENDETYEWFELTNAHTLVEGFVLKRAALREIENGTLSPDYHRSAFCLFITTRGIVD